MYNIDLVEVLHHLPRTDPLNSHEHMLHTCMGLLRTYVAFLLPDTVRAEAIATLP